MGDGCRCSNAGRAFTVPVTIARDTITAFTLGGGDRSRCRAPQVAPIRRVLVRDRRYELIDVAKIKVINSRLRDAKQFDMNVQSIEQTGLMKPIRVNDKFVARTGLYELVCGEGRLIAHKRLNKPTIMAEVITCTRKDAYLQSLVENIARTKPGTMDFARELKRLHDEGWTFEALSRVAVRSVSYIRQYIKLVEQGEERLIIGVERGVFPISFAVLVARSQSEDVQNLLMDAFDQDLITTENFAAARRIIATRLTGGQKVNSNGRKYTVQELRKDITDATRTKNSFVREAKTKENRFLTLVSAIDILWEDEEFLRIVQAEDLARRPKLVGLGADTAS